MQNQNIVIKFNPLEAEKAGAMYVNTTGAYVLLIKSAYWKTNPNTGSAYLEISGITSNGESANFISFFYADKAGMPLNYGNRLVNAMIGLLGINQLSSLFDTSSNNYYCPELINKTVGMFLQKSSYTKEDGTQGIRLSCLDMFDPTTQKTYAEHQRNLPAEKISKLSATITDRVEKPKTSTTQASTQTNDAPF